MCNKCRKFTEPVDLVTVESNIKTIGKSTSPKTKVYISGKITGKSKNVYMKDFYDAQQKLEQQGYEVINPALVNSNLPETTTWEQYMEMSILMLNMCDSIFLLKDWQDSKGAKWEYEHALDKGKTVIFQK